MAVNIGVYLIFLTVFTSKLDYGAILTILCYSLTSNMWNTNKLYTCIYMKYIHIYS